MASRIGGTPTLNSVQKSGNSVYLASANTTAISIKNSLTNEVLKLFATSLNNGGILISKDDGTNMMQFSGGGNSYINSGNEQLILGDTISDGSCIMHMVSTTRCMGLPRMTTAQMNAISSPRTGGIIYNTDLNQICVYIGTKWQKVTQTDV